MSRTDFFIAIWVAEKSNSAERAGDYGNFSVIVLGDKNNVVILQGKITVIADG